MSDVAIDGQTPWTDYSVKFTRGSRMQRINGGGPASAARLLDLDDGAIRQRQLFGAMGYGVCGTS